MRLLICFFLLLGCSPSSETIHDAENANPNVAVEDCDKKAENAKLTLDADGQEVIGLQGSKDKGCTLE